MSSKRKALRQPSVDESVSKEVKKEKTGKKVAHTGTAPVKKATSGASYHEEVRKLKASVPLWDGLLQENIEGSRGEVWDEVQRSSEELCHRFAWAIPDERALKVLAHFSPLVEIGAGKGYWARLLQDRGVDVLAYDKYTAALEDCWTKVKAGGPEVLTKNSMAERNLFLCYPDEQESIASVCLDNFQGEYIVHVGETIWTGTAMGVPVAPFGRTSSADFQVSLAESFHCILQAKLSVTYPFSRDCISVWKRTRFVQGRDHQNVANADGGEAEEEVEEQPVGKNNKKKKAASEEVQEPVKKKKSKKEAASNDGVEFIDISDLAALREAALDMQYNEDHESRWASIPEDEVLPVDRAAPCLQHLLA